MPVRVGLYGGTFDPIHVGHLMVARAVREQLGLDRIILIPNARPPHKAPDHLTVISHRLAMTRLAAEDEPGFDISDCEARRNGPSFTIDTVDHFRTLLSSHTEIVWLIGSDSLRELAGWHRIEELVEACRIVTAVRPGWEAPDLAPLEERLSRPQVQRLLDNVLNTPRIDVSSTEIRRRLAASMSIRWMVPSPVRYYIYEHGLYSGALPEAGTEHSGHGCEKQGV